ncbi:MAG: MFS transporter [Nostocoides sp.]
MTGRGAATTARLLGRGTRGGTNTFRTFAASRGADQSGLARLTEMHAVQVAGDAALTVALAGTVFAMPTGQARGQVGLFLLTTMAPFALLAPLIGPVLDRFRHGRRWAIGTTLAVRAFLAWVLAGLVTSGSAWLFPTALVALVASKAYAVARAAAVPRLIPAGFSLVSANSRLSIAGLVGMALGGAVAGPLSRIGPQWSLRAAFVIYVAATVLAIRLPARVDSEPPVHADPAPATYPSAATPQRTGGSAPRVPTATAVRARFGSLAAALPTAVRFALAACAGARILSGFLTLFLAFLMRIDPLPGWKGPIVLGIAVASAVVGNAAGSLVGSRLRGPRPERVAAILPLLAIASTLAAATFWSIWTVVVIGLVTGLFGQLGKLCLDALIQRDVPERVRARVFAVTETVLQMAWVIGGGVGIAVPMRADTGFGIVTVLLTISLAVALRVRWSGRPSGSRDPRPATP